MSKYGNQKTTVYGITFDSKREAYRYLELRDMEQRGVISCLALQKEFEIIPRMKINGKAYRAIRYIADFTYMQDGQLVVEDAKGCRTREYGIKLRLMKKYHNIDVKEV